MKIKNIPTKLLENIKRGIVIPAHPLALDSEGKLDVRHQKALTRYYLNAGAGGIAIGVHTTQFEIRDPKIGLFSAVLSLASETIDEFCSQTVEEILKIAGVCGNTDQAVKEAILARNLGYHACLLKLGGLEDNSISSLLSHCRKVAEVMPIIGFYLQSKAGGILLPYKFWKKFAEIENVLAIKIAPFNRYQTIDVIRAICDAGKENDITLYTGNDDNIVLDLLSEYEFKTRTGTKSVRIKGGLLGHWAVWTKKAVELLEQIHSIIDNNEPIPAEMLKLAIHITDANAVLFDAANNFAGCIPGIHELLRRQGLMKGLWCLNPKEKLSAGQKEEIDRIYRSYPEMSDDDFVRENLDEWLK